MYTNNHQQQVPPMPMFTFAPEGGQQMQPQQQPLTSLQPQVQQPTICILQHQQLAPQPPQVIYNQAGGSFCGTFGVSTGTIGPGASNDSGQGSMHGGSSLGYSGSSSNGQVNNGSGFLGCSGGADLGCSGSGSSPQNNGPLNNNDVVGFRHIPGLGAAPNFGPAPAFPAHPEKHPQQQQQPQQQASNGGGSQSRMSVKVGPRPQAPNGPVVKKVAMMHADVLPIPNPEDQGPKQLIVNYIAAQVKITELFALFEQFGPLECAKILLDQEGHTRGFGFVYFGTSADAAEALKELQSFEFYGKYLRIGYAVPQRSPPVKE